MNGFDKLQNAALLIREMTNSQFKYSSTGAFVYSDRDDRIAINMRKETDSETGVCRIHFDASLLPADNPMDSSALMQLGEEVEAAHALLVLLEESEYILSPEEMRKFNEYIRDVLSEEQTAGPVMGSQTF